MKKKIDALKEAFWLMPEWTERYNYLVEIGESLPEMPAIRCCISTCAISKTFAIYLLLPMLRFLPGWPPCFFNLCNGVFQKEIRDNMPYLLATLKE